MFPFFKKKPKTWIDQSVIDYLMGIHPLFVIYYSVRVNGQSTLFKFRDEQGRFLADIYVNHLSEQQRERFTRFLNRLDCGCILVEVTMHLNHATEEEIVATQTELDMLEMVDEEEEY